MVIERVRRDTGVAGCTRNLKSAIRKADSSLLMTTLAELPFAPVDIATDFKLSADGRIATWNDQAQEMFGYADEEAIGRHFVWLCPLEQVQSGEPERTLRVAAESGSVQEDRWLLRRDHSKIRASVQIRAIRNTQANISGFAISTHGLD